MVRITKDPEERKDEIIKAAQRLFIEKGFAQTKISDIVKSIGVSQGVFYYYFKSKEEIIDTIVEKYINRLVEEGSAVADQEELTPLEKLEKMAEIQLTINLQENNNIHSIKGVDIHEKILNRLILGYVPLMAKSFQGTLEESVLHQIEIFMTAGNVLFDPGYFRWEKEEKNKRIESFISFMEASLNLPGGSLSFYKELMGFAE